MTPPAFAPFFFICVVLLAGWPTGEIRAQQSTSDSLEKLLAQPMPDTSRTLLLEKIGGALMYSQPLEAMKYVKEGLALAERIEYPAGIARTMNRMGSIYRNTGSYTKALEAHLEALKVAGENGDLNGMARINNSIGILYSEQKDSRKAIQYFTKTKLLAQQLRDAELLEISLTNLGTDYALLNQLDSAQTYTLRAYEMAKKNKSESTSNMLFINLGNIHYRQKNYPLALNYYRRSLPLSEAQADSLNLSLTYFEMARTFLETGSLDSSRFYSEIALRLAQQVNNPKNIFDAGTLLSTLYENSDVGKSYGYFKIAMAAKDRMFAQEKVRQLENMQFNEALNAQQQTYENLYYRNTLRLYALLAGIVAALLVSFLLYRNVRQRQKANELLQHQKEELQDTLTELQSAQDQLIQSEKMASLGELTAGIAHEIQNPLNFVNNYSEVNLELIEELIVEEEFVAKNENLIKELIRDLADNERKIHHHGKQAEAIIRGMLEHSRRSSGTREPTDFNALVAEYVDLAYHGMNAKDKVARDVVSTDFEPDFPILDLIPGDIGRVILNLLHNAFYAVAQKKDAQPAGYLPAIMVITRRRGGAVELRIRDNGTGIPARNLSKIFQPFFTTKPTGQGTGLGLSLAYDIVTKGHGGYLRAESEEGSGAEFIVVLPDPF